MARGRLERILDRSLGMIRAPLLVTGIGLAGLVGGCSKGSPFPGGPPLPSSCSTPEIPSIQDSFGRWIGGQFHALTGLVDSYAFDPPPFATTGYTYDQALACIVFADLGLFNLGQRILCAYDNELASYSLGPGMGRAFYQGYDVNTQAVTQPLLLSGDNAWLMLAITYYTVRSGDMQFVPLAEGIAQHLRAIQDPFDGGIFLDPSQPYTQGVKSLEHNLAAYAGFRNLGAITSNQTYLDAQAALGMFVESLWNWQTYSFFRGTSYAGVDPIIAADVNTQPTLAVGNIGPQGQPYNGAIGYAIVHLGQTDPTVNVTGLAFDETWPASLVSMEQTAILSEALFSVGNLSLGQHYLLEVLKLQGPDGGVLHTSPSLFPPGWPIFPYPSVAATSWGYFANQQTNPYSPYFNP